MSARRAAPGPAASRLDPLALGVADAAKLLSRVGGQTVAEATIRGDVEAGAPVNADGTINLIHYAAWLAREAMREEA
jgi:hypothetical protein